MTLMNAPATNSTAVARPASRLGGHASALVAVLRLYDHWQAEFLGQFHAA